ncbi:hypothetical protein DFH06DRAFT_1145734 [Mycena polygramma]|nr:hypothetical protein DFH06DRAFT_1145734 [Mycena polygramma]
MFANFPGVFRDADRTTKKTAIERTPNRDMHARALFQSNIRLGHFCLLKLKKGSKKGLEKGSKRAVKNKHSQRKEWKATHFYLPRRFGFETKVENGIALRGESEGTWPHGGANGAKGVESRGIRVQVAFRSGPRRTRCHRAVWSAFGHAFDVPIAVEAGWRGIRVRGTRLGHDSQGIRVHDIDLGQEFRGIRVHSPHSFAGGRFWTAAQSGAGFQGIRVRGTRLGQEFQGIRIRRFALGLRFERNTMHVKHLGQEFSGIRIRCFALGARIQRNPDTWLHTWGKNSAESGYVASHLGQEWKGMRELLRLGYDLEGMRIHGIDLGQEFGGIRKHSPHSSVGGRFWTAAQSLGQDSGGF